uniref:Bloodthirsty-related gene family, member 30 n=1 Tax=Tetraodon nigroviridis TaxID=99883 RepID=H3C3I9_TETNG
PMAEAGALDLFSEQELTCSICLDLFDEPVSTPCGHNFCQACIGGYWASSAVCTCPLCKHQFDERPQLSVNKVFALIAHKFKETRAAAGEEVVWCDVCTGVKRPATSSCLTCTASYCAEHEQPHRSTPFYAKHPLMDPREALRGRTCDLHRRLLEVYCRICQRCICAICVLEEHRTHKTVSVQTERLGKQEMVNRIKDREMRVSQLKKKMEAAKSYADAERAELGHLLDEVSRSLDRIRSQVLGDIDSQLDGVMSKGEGLVRRLEAELSLLSDRRATLEVQAINQDHIGFLQSYQEATAPLEENQQSELTAAESVLSLRGSSANLRRTDVKKNKQVTDVKKNKQVTEDVTLNPVTAYPFLILSDDRKQVKRGEKLQFFRNSQQRFDVWSCVMAKEGFSSGRHYWEVFVGDSKDWKVGVVTEAAQRKGLFDMTPASGYYALWWSGSHLRALTTPPLAKVKAPLKLRQVGVFLDMDEGQVTFYNIKSGSEIYSFARGREFTDRMFPLFGTGDKDVPLVLMTTQHH